MPSVSTSETHKSATVTSVTATGAPGNYSFSVTIVSPDTGCDQYANWWEVITPEGELLYRRILAHSHVSEQPFTRSGGPVPVQADQSVIVRAHMHPSGYGKQVLQGSVASGFEELVSESAIAPELASQPPLPDGCAF